MLLFSRLQSHPADHELGCIPPVEKNYHKALNTVFYIANHYILVKVKG
jgi:hypothetical protein